MRLFQSSGSVHDAHSLIWLAVTLTGMKPLLVTPVLLHKMSAVKPINKRVQDMSGAVVGKIRQY